MTKEGTAELRDLAASGIDRAISAARAQEGGFFECAISTTSYVPRSGSVRPLSDDVPYDKDAEKVCDAMLRDFKVDMAQFDYRYGI